MLGKSASVLALAAALSFDLSHGASAASWTAEQILAPAAAGGTIHIASAVNASGVAAAVWDQVLPSGLTQVRAAVRGPAGWSAAQPLSDPTVGAANGGVEVDPAGRVTVFFATNAGVYESVSVDGGASFGAPAALPADAGYNLIGGHGVDTAGHVELILDVVRSSRPYLVDSEAIVKGPDGVWTGPVKISTGGTGGYRFHMNQAGQAMLVAGAYTYFSPAPGQWNAPQTVPLAGQIFSTDFALDPSGNAYYLYRGHYSGVNLTVSKLGGAWSKPRHFAKFDGLYSPVMIASAGSGQLLVYGIDYTTNAARAALSTDAGATFGSLAVLGGNLNRPAVNIAATGSEQGLFAVSWDINAGPLVIATGAASPAGITWTKSTLSTLNPVAAVAVTGAQAVAAWARGGNAAYSTSVVGASTTTLP